MKITRGNLVELAPSLEWHRFTSAHASILVNPDYEVLDRITPLRLLLEGELQAAELRGDALGGGSEGQAWKVSSADGVVMKVPNKKPEPTDFSDFALNMARFGGACVEAATHDLVVGSSNIQTPHYYALLRTPGTEGLFMSLAEGESLGEHANRGSITRQGAEELAAHVSAAVCDRIEEMGYLPEALAPNAEICEDMHAFNIFAQLRDGCVDLERLTVIDAFSVLSLGSMLAIKYAKGRTV